MADVDSLPKQRRFPALLELGQAAIKRNDSLLQKEVLQAIGELGTDDSVPFIEDWLANSNLEMTWPDLIKGIFSGAQSAETLWKDRVFNALERSLGEPSNSHRFAPWPFVSWPAAMIEIDPERAVRAFTKHNLLLSGSPGFAATITAINESSKAVVPAEVAAVWLPSSPPDLGDRIAGEHYLLQLRAHAELDLPAVKQRLWQLIDDDGPLALEAAALLLRAERLPDPVWTLDTRVQKVGIENVRLAERVVWIVANWFTFPIATSGFAQFAVSYEAQYLSRIIEALLEVDAKETAYCLREWSLIFGNEWPVGQYEREELVDALKLKPAEAWTSILERSRCTENVVLLNLRYQLNHADQFERRDPES